MMKKWLAVALSLTMIVGMMTACGSGDEANTNEGSNNDSSTQVETIADGGGKVLNIYVWNDDFQNRFEKYYKDYDKKTKSIGDVKVNIIQNANQGSNYQDKLDAALAAQDSAAADDKVDIFLCETDYVNKYTSSDMAAPISALGITDSDLSQMYDFTKTAATDASGILRGVTWQANPAGFIYRRSYAKEIFGTDDPAKIQEQVSDWDKFTAAAQTVKEKSDGKITMLSGFSDALRVYAANVTQKWVSDDKKLQIDPEIEKWIDATKEYTDNGYNAKTALWSDDWSAGFKKNGNVFGYFGPAWLINFSMSEGSGAKKNDDGTYEPGGSYGDWAVCEGPQAFNWGGTFICGAKGTDNAALVADIMKTLCCDTDNMYNLTIDFQEFVNNKKANDKLVADGVTSAFLGGQSLVEGLSAGIDKINMSYLSPYDQMCFENLMTAMADYYNGKSTKEEAIENWKDMTIKSYPALSK
ncbi:MAG: carbohydrate ABC transporter substrate-binding protein [Lachnospiraceae bacterium]|nr:carbohydrate ABC transporter substrate-binding protein [Lachnospiraceae bacterium]